MLIYPQKIIPSTKYIRKLPLNELSASSQYMIHRRSEHLKDDCFINGIVDRVHMKPNMGITQVLHLSVNLLGGKFTVPADQLWRQIDKGSETWQGEEIHLDDYIGCYELKQGDYPDFFFRIMDIYDKELVYPRTFRNSNESESYTIVQREMDSVQEINHGTPQPVAAKLTVEHSPTNLNYWHCQIECDTLHIPENERLEKRKARWEKELLNKIDFMLRSIVFFSQIDQKEIAESYYMRK